MKGIEDRTVVVTGAGSGIGRGSAERFAAEGANVVVADIDEDGGRATVDAITEAGGEATFVEVDVSDAAHVEAMVETALEEYGGLDFAHNNAGIDRGVGPIAEVDEADFDRMTAVHAKGVWLCMKYELPHIAASDAGAIVNTSSTAGLVAAPGRAHYSMAKHGVVGLTRSAALEYAEEGVRVNAICPGVVDTAMARANEGTIEALAEFTPLGRAAEPAELGAAAVWLCSADASFVTGVSLPVDGGMIAGP